MDGTPSDDRTRAERLLEIYRGDADDYFKLWPPDKKYYFCSDKKSFIAYRVKNKIAVCMGDPVGPDRSIRLLLKEFKLYCQQRNRHVVFILCSDKYTGQFLASGYHDLLIGADAIIDLDHFYEATSHNKYFRNIFNRFKKSGYSVEKHSPPHSDKLLDEVKDVSDSWLKIPHRKEWLFATGRFHKEYLNKVPLYVLVDKSGKAQAFSNELPSYRAGIATIDLMRHRANSPPNSIDYLFVQMIKSMREEGYEGLSLGTSPMAGKQFAKSFGSKIIFQLYKLGNIFISATGLHRFKAKYRPDWEPRYVYYEGNKLVLVKMVATVMSLMTKP